MTDPRPETSAALVSAVDSVSSGPWAVGVSGGADSIALLALLRRRRDVMPHVVHINHQLRGSASTGDAMFVADLAASWVLPKSILLREALESEAEKLPSNPSARYRALRHKAFRRVVTENRLNGVILAHHADDQAETVMLRLLRGSGPAGLVGMAPMAKVGGLRICRPLLKVRRLELRNFLTAAGQLWREDASNASNRYRRNLVRRLLEQEYINANWAGSAPPTNGAEMVRGADPTGIGGAQPHCTERLLELSERCRALREWVKGEAPRLEPAFAAAALHLLPAIVRQESARQWLISRGVPRRLLQSSPKAIEQLIAMATDAGAPHRQSFPGGLLVRRRKGIIRAER